ncbi:MAG: DNA mismatch repair endonuclease MutL [Deltaproteobacteria bacterium]|nr:DNA mismatch repair endonuclease MutL [Deltaproteobacteria bacterium]
MPGKIKILDELLASKIAAGEVIERPASVLKELLENSIDAGATSITVYVTEGGKRLISVTDNGEGISKEDAPLVFFRHATSKIKTEADLDDIRTMGFRGEALSSISAVARVRLRTKRRAEVSGTSVLIEGGSAPEIIDDGCPEGTTIEVKDIFYNTPARLKFMRSGESEYGYILDVFKRTALIHPEIMFKLVHGSSRPIEAPAGSLRERIADLFGKDAAASLIEVATPFVKGCIGSHELNYATAKSVYLYVNGRPVRDKGITRALLDGYGTIIDGMRYPFVVLDMIVAPEDVDVNIHPAKNEVRFKSPRFIYDCVKAGVKGALSSARPAAPGPTVSYSASTPAWRPHAGEGPSFYEPAALIPFEFREERREAVNPEFLSLSTVGQLWGEFLIAENPSGEFYLIDQHGAAERAAFERLRKRYTESQVRRQMLLLPERFETTPEEKDAVTRSLEELSRLGFEIMDFGPSGERGGATFLIKAVPDILTARSSAGLIKDIAEELASGGGSSRAEVKIEEVLMRIACHGVIRGPRPLTKEEGNALLRELSGVDFAAHCPHGRPVVKKFLRSEIEAMFKR